MKKTKRKRGDRRDGVWLRDLDALHAIVPYLYPNRADNEAFISERIDLGPIKEYLEKKNADNQGEPYKFFQVLVAAIVKTITLRPKMNRFIQGYRIGDGIQGENDIFPGDIHLLCQFFDGRFPLMGIDKSFFGLQCPICRVPHGTGYPDGTVIPQIAPYFTDNHWHGIGGEPYI